MKRKDSEQLGFRIITCRSFDFIKYTSYMLIWNRIYLNFFTKSKMDSKDKRDKYNCLYCMRVCWLHLTNEDAIYYVYMPFSLLEEDVKEYNIWIFSNRLFILEVVKKGGGGRLVWTKVQFLLNIRHARSVSIRLTMKCQLNLILLYLD